MAHLLRGKQAGISHDLSAGIAASVFNVDDLARVGVNSQTSCVAYDPVQSLLAVGTKNSQFGPGQIYVFGQKRVQVTLALPTHGASVTALQFCAEKLVCLDSKHELSIYSLELRSLVANYRPPGAAAVLCTDPMLDYAFIGMQSGDILAYDMERESLAPFRLSNMWTQLDPLARSTTVISLQFHPRDIGTLLVGYNHGAVIYSFKLGKAIRFFQYEVPRGAPGGDGDPMTKNIVRKPKVVQAVWHPTGTFVMTGHDDGSIVFWDTLKDGRMLMARTLTDTNIAVPGAMSGSLSPMGESRAPKEPLFRLAWCANQDPEDTAILIAGGQSADSPMKGLTLFEMGRTPTYATSSWEFLAQYFAEPKRQRILPTPPGAEVVGFCLIPRSSPHFAGAHDPVAVIALLAVGELLTLTFPSGMPIAPNTQLPPSLNLIHPFVKSLNVTQAGRERWLGMTERRQQGPPILQGGTELPRHLRRYENRNIVQTVHADGTIRIWDIGHGDEVENDRTLQVDISRAVGRFRNVDVAQVSMSGASGELAVGLRSGELIVFRWGVNRNAGREPPTPQTNQPGALTSVTDRVDPGLSEGLIPVTLLDQQNGPITAIRMSDVGFLAAGFEGGSIVIIDMRGPAIIYSGTVYDYSRGQSKGSVRRRPSNATGSKPEWATHMEFSVMMLDGEDYSSVLLHVGTNVGHLGTFKILPDPSGRYTVQYVGSVAIDNRVIRIAPINADTGQPASASQTAVSNLRTGLRVNGALVAVTVTSIHIFRPATSKGAHKSFDSFFCDSAEVVRYQDQGYALVGLFGDGAARAYSLPSLREIASIQLGDKLSVRRFPDAVVTPTGHILGFTGPSELALVNLFGTGQQLTRGMDKIYDPNRLIPPRPAISAVQWVTGTQYVTPSDMDTLIGGPDRPPSKRMLAQARAEEEQLRQQGPAGSSATSVAASTGQQESYWNYMQRQIQERTERLGIVGDSMQQLEENSASWADEVGKFVNRQKKNAAAGIIKARFGI